MNKSGDFYSFKPKDIVKDIGVTKIKSPNPIGLEGLPIIPAKSHVQEVARYEDYLIMTHNSESEEADYGSIVRLSEKNEEALYRMS